MKSILFTADDRIYYLTIDTRFRGGTYQIADKVPLSVPVNYSVPFGPLNIKVRTFVWRGQVVRKDRSELCDFFEEQA